MTPPAPVAVKRRRKRISRWDRPKEPHDWRWVVGHIGRALITIGLMMFGFVAYQLWGTGIQTARAQDQLKSQFQDQLTGLGITPDTIAPPTSTTVPVTDTTATTAPGSDPTATTLPADITTTTTSIEPVPQIYGNVQPGDSLGEIRIRKIDLDFYIVAGVSKQNLSDGVGHFPNTPLPGQLGNSALAGHRTTHLAPFYDLDKLEPGDEIEITTILGDAYVYIVTDSIVVTPSDYNVVTDSDPTKATLTLITCTPIGTSSHRLVVHATLDPTRGSPVGEASIYYGEGDGASTFDPTLPDEDPVSTEGTTPAGGTLPVSTEPAAAVTTPSSGGATTTAAATAATTVSSIDPADQFADDAFDAGWFDDSAAFAQVALWGLLFALVWYGAYRIAKWRRNAFIGIAVGIVPFVIVLYFFYENVNRLLPAAI